MYSSITSSPQREQILLSDSVRYPQAYPEIVADSRKLRVLGRVRWRLLIEAVGYRWRVVRQAELLLRPPLSWLPRLGCCHGCGLHHYVSCHLEPLLGRRDDGPVVDRRRASDGHVDR